MKISDTASSIIKHGCTAIDMTVESFLQYKYPMDDPISLSPGAESLNHQALNDTAIKQKTIYYRNLYTQKQQKTQSALKNST
jgi:hypothetical protein